jgi:hypothetical protein
MHHQLILVLLESQGVSIRIGNQNRGQLLAIFEGSSVRCNLIDDIDWGEGLRC